MFFLQHATGRSPERLSASGLRSISGTKALDAELVFGGANLRPHASSDLEPNEHIVSEIESDCAEIDRELEV